MGVEGVSIKNYIYKLKNYIISNKKSKIRYKNKWQIIRYIFFYSNAFQLYKSVSLQYPHSIGFHLSLSLDNIIFFIILL